MAELPSRMDAKPFAPWRLDPKNLNAGINY
jgi:hypothetical protein